MQTAAIQADPGDTSIMATTKVRTVRVDEKLWTTAQEVASDERETVATVIKRALVAYCREHGRDVS